MRMHGARTVGAVVIAAMGLAMVAGCKGKSSSNNVFALPSTSSAAVVFDDGFTTDQGWTGNAPGEIFVDTANGEISWHADRSKVQTLSIPLTQPVSGVVTLEFTGTIDQAANNCWIQVGLVEDVSPPGTGLYPPGLYAELWFFGGGCSNSFYFAEGRMVFSGGQHVQLSSGYVCNFSDGQQVKVQQGQRVRCVLTTANGLLTLTVFDELTGTQLGTQSTNYLSALPAFNHVVVANYGIGDWPTADGTIDRIRVTTP